MEENHFITGGRKPTPTDAERFSVSRCFFQTAIYRAVSEQCEQISGLT